MATKKILKSKVKKMQPGGMARDNTAYSVPIVPKGKSPGYLDNIGDKSTYLYDIYEDLKNWRDYRKKTPTERLTGETSYLQNIPFFDYPMSPNSADRDRMEAYFKGYDPFDVWRAADVYGSTVDYINSDEYLNRLKNFYPEKIAKNIQKKRAGEVLNTRVALPKEKGPYREGLGESLGFYAPYNKAVVIFNGTAGTGSLLGHELTHASQYGTPSGYKVSKALPDWMSKEEKELIKSSLASQEQSGFSPEFYKYVTNPTEYHARLNSLRRVALDLGVHKKFGENFNQDQLNKVKEYLESTKYGGSQDAYLDVYQLFNITNDDKNLIRNLNTIAYEDTQPKTESDISYARQGGRILKSKSSIPPVPKPAVMQAQGGGFFSKLGNTVSDYGRGLADAFLNTWGADLSNEGYKTNFGKKIAGGVDKYAKTIGSVNNAIADFVLPGAGSIKSAVGNFANVAMAPKQTQMPAMPTQSTNTGYDMSSLFGNPNNLAMLNSLAGSLVGSGGGQSSFLPMLGGFGMAKDGGRILSKRYSYDLEDDDMYEPRDYEYDLPEEMADGGIPQRYRNLGFNKVGQKRKSNRPGKKWMVLAKKGDEYKIVHGGAVGMSDFTKHKNQKRRDRFWDRMGGKDSAKANDPFSPLYWHKRFGTW